MRTEEKVIDLMESDLGFQRKRRLRIKLEGRRLPKNQELSKKKTEKDFLFMTLI